MHIAQIGIGRVGRPTAYTIMSAGLADELTVCDIKPGLAAAFAEELKHVMSSIGLAVKVNSCDKDEAVTGADVILISAGEPRTPGVKMSRRDLAIQNAKIIKQISESMASRNRGAKYIVISNPVDAMAMVCKKFTRADFVISTGTNLDSLRFRSRIAEVLAIPTSQVQGWVGGEHGDAALPLWSTTRVSNIPIDKYVAMENKMLLKDEVDTYMKTVSKLIVDNIGGTEYGPAASFRDITMAITKDTREILSIAAPFKFKDIHESVFVGMPTRLGKAVGPTLFENLSDGEKEGIASAAKAIYQTYLVATENL